MMFVTIFDFGATFSIFQYQSHFVLMSSHRALSMRRKGI